MTMTIETLLKQLEDEMNKAYDLGHEYIAKAQKSSELHDRNSEAYYDYMSSKELDKARRLHIAIDVIEERVT